MQRDIDNASNVAVVSKSTASKMGGSDINSVLGKETVLFVGDKILSVSIVGIYDDSLSQSDTIYMPISAVKRVGGGDVGYGTFTVIASETVDIATFNTDLQNHLNDYYINDDEYHITTMTMESMLESLSSMMDTISIALSVIAGISLLVGGIGVMNIMLVTVTERTKEIGTIKALGATGKQIKMQFVVEGVIICGIGGIIGMILGSTVGYLGSMLLGSPMLPSLISALVAAGISLAIGVFFSYSPAKKAASLHPIEALRYE